MPPPIHQQHILIVREHYPHQHLAAHGVQNFALTLPDWKLGVCNIQSRIPQDIQDVLGWTPDGILILTKHSLFSDFFPALPDIPVVVLDLYLDRPEGIPRVEVDEYGVGQTAGNFFLQNGFRHLGVVKGPRNHIFAAEREKGFREVATGAGRDCHRFTAKHHGGRPWLEDSRLDAWLQAIPKPIGVYCTQDMVAVGVHEHCQRLGIRIPSEVSLLGTDNNRVNCESVRPHLSSIEMPFVRAGYEAAHLLFDLIQAQSRGIPLKDPVRIVSPEKLVERQSTSLRMIPDPAIAAAANYLQDHALEGKGIDDAARYAGINRRKLERGFREHLDISPGVFIQNLKLDHAKRLIADTTLPFWNVAESCSMSQEHLTRFFKKETGMTPNAFRKRHRQLQPDFG